ncbi:8-oxo-dGTP pyrophosphatase MutT (NUDIX family) [Palleronia aestuarii]|uniref:8-oxo-dGTP pyrophosphatase MutT (NUDIX family) n=1 Tax=Palleronia aestuarii TaxID=568105 RepID=A0A2W7NC58_9RHOB|nr:NUDIX hydrolase [Palleronia aestuarii]PZX17193.1 8-oxo-dGTP pyrophosphatase MutT (NUDIX family) [Palleronia aestuarii]
MAAYKRQVAALPIRKRRGKIEVMLVTTRGTGRWTPPKGWPMRHKTPWKTAQIEAYEEAGVSGPVGSDPLGRFDYKKKSRGSTIHRVTVFPLRVTRVHARWDEKGARDRRWFTLREAARAVRSPRLKKLLRGLRGSKTKV